MTGLKIVAFIFIITGAFINYGAKLIVNRTGLAGRINVAEAEELTGEDLEKYRLTKAIARVKIIGLLVLLPGVLMVFIAFR